MLFWPWETHDTIQLILLGIVRISALLAFGLSWMWPISHDNDWVGWAQQFCTMHRCVEDTKNTCVQALGTVYGIVWSAPNAKNDTDILERWRYDDIEIGVILICTCVNVLIAKRFECAHAFCLLFNIQVFLLALDTGTLENTVLRCPNHHIGMWNRFRGIPFSIFSSFCCLCRIVFTLALVCPFWSQWSLPSNKNGAQRGCWWLAV